MTGYEHWDGYVELGYIVSEVVPSNKISGVDRDYVANNVLCGCLFFFILINLFMFVGN